jgi:Flp pilus assembly protein TadG
MKVHTRSARRGQVVVLVAMMATLLFGLAAIALDLSMAMSDRRVLQANVDAAALAGAVEYSTSTNAAHWVALQYLQKPLGYTLPLGSCTSKTACPAGAYTTGTYTITIGDPAAKLMDLSIQHTEPGLFANIIGATVKTGNSVRTSAPGPTIIVPNYGVVATQSVVNVTGGGATNRVFGNNVWVATDFGDNNGGGHTTVMTYVTDLAGVTCPGNIPVHVDHGAATNALAFTWSPAPGTELFNINPAPTPYDNYSPTVPAGAPTFGSAGFPLNAQDASGNWKPGIYDGVYPSAPGKLNPGVFKLINNTSPMNFGALTQVTYTAAGTEDAAGAIVIVLDSSDTAAMDISAVKLNGIDDLHPQSYVGPRDPQGTHNFVFFGGNGATAYTGSQNFGPGTNFDISGIFYVPKYTATGTGNPVELLTGQITVAAWTIAGGGGSSQVMRWVCGLGMVLSNTATQGGINR